MHDNIAVGGREAEDTLYQWLRVDRECDSGSEWQVVRHSKKGKTHPASNVENRYTDLVTLRLTTALILARFLLLRRTECHLLKCEHICGVK